jgi:uncharacterized protein (UPF0333 family)
MFAGALIVSALTISQRAKVSLSLLLLVVAGLMLAIGVLCVIAHLDANRGRKARVFQYSHERP